jgi:acetyltransferase-like isoleucine patch superfamily enzyme
LTASVIVGRHCVVMPQVVLTHGDVVEDFCTIASGVRVGGRASLREGCYLGAGSLVREDRTIGRAALVGMGAVVLTDVPDGETWVGNPARRLHPVSAETPLSRRSS